MGVFVLRVTVVLLGVFAIARGHRVAGSAEVCLGLHRGFCDVHVLLRGYHQQVQTFALLWKPRLKLSRLRWGVPNVPLRNGVWW